MYFVTVAFCIIWLWVKNHGGNVQFAMNPFMAGIWEASYSFVFVTMENLTPIKMTICLKWIGLLWNCWSGRRYVLAIILILYINIIFRYAENILEFCIFQNYLLVIYFTIFFICDYYLFNLYSNCFILGNYYLFNLYSNCFILGNYYLFNLSYYLFGLSF